MTTPQTFYLRALFNTIDGPMTAPADDSPQFQLEAFILANQGNLAVVADIENMFDTQTIQRYATDGLIPGVTAPGAAQLNQAAALLAAGDSEEATLGAVFGNSAYFSSFAFRVSAIQLDFQTLLQQNLPATSPQVLSFAHGTLPLRQIREASRLATSSSTW